MQKIKNPFTARHIVYYYNVIRGGCYASGITYTRSGLHKSRGVNGFCYRGVRLSLVCKK